MVTINKECFDYYLLLWDQTYDIFVSVTTVSTIFLKDLCTPVNIFFECLKGHYSSC